MLYPFHELSTSDDCTTFAYWILVEERELPHDAITPDSLSNWMSYHHDVEEQAYTAEMLNSDDELIPSHIRPIAPVTLAKNWTPFSTAQAALGTPVRMEREDSWRSAAFAIWKPKPLAEFKPTDRSEHATHFTFLLKHACDKAIEVSGRIVIVGEPGWSYEYWKQSDRIPPHTKELMDAAGYVYSDRIAN